MQSITRRFPLYRVGLAKSLLSSFLLIGIAGYGTGQTSHGMDSTVYDALQLFRRLPVHPTLGSVINAALEMRALDSGPAASPSMEPKAFAVKGGREPGIAGSVNVRIYPTGSLPTRFVQANAGRWPNRAGYVVVVTESLGATLFSARARSKHIRDTISAKERCTSIEFACGDPEGTSVSSKIAGLKFAFGTPISERVERSADNADHILVWRLSNGVRVTYKSFEGIFLDFPAK